MHTAGYVTQGKFNTDLQLFISAADAVGGTAANIGTSGYIGKTIAASQTNANLQLNFSGLMLRTGMLQSQALGMAASQEAFGTAAATPGPSSVSGTSGPSAFGPNSVVAPVPAAALATLIGSVSGAAKKGIQINYMDFIYAVQTAAATSVGASAGVLTLPAPGLDLTTVATALFSATTLSAAVNSNNTTKVHRQRIIISGAAPLVTDCSVVSVLFNVTTPVNSVVGLIGILLGCSYNLN